MVFKRGWKTLNKRQLSSWEHHQIMIHQMFSLKTPVYIHLYGISMDFPYFPMCFPIFSHVVPMLFPMLFPYIKMCFPFPYRPMCFPLFSHAFPMFFPWCSPIFQCVFLEVFPKLFRCSDVFPVCSCVSYILPCFPHIFPKPYVPMCFPLFIEDSHADLSLPSLIAPFSQSGPQRRPGIRDQLSPGGAKQSMAILYNILITINY